MRYLSRIIGIVTVLLAGSPYAAESAQAVEIDRLLAAVNGRVITVGDFTLAHSLNVLLHSGSTGKLLSRKEEIDHLIDLELMRQEMGNSPMTPEEEARVDARMEGIRSAFADKGGLSAVLHNLGLQESELTEYIRLQASTLRFIDFRFRPFVVVSAEEIRSYYQEKLLPELARSHSSVPPLEEVSSRIESILKEEKIDSALDQWMRDARRRARIELFDAEP
jgi:hypothetical protein